MMKVISVLFPILLFSNIGYSEELKIEKQIEEALKAIDNGNVIPAISFFIKRAKEDELSYDKFVFSDLSSRYGYQLIQSLRCLFLENALINYGHALNLANFLPKSVEKNLVISKILEEISRIKEKTKLQGC